MDNRCLCFITTALDSVNGINNESTLPHLKIAETLADKVDCLSLYKQPSSARAGRLIKQFGNLDIWKFITEYTELVPHIIDQYKKTRATGDTFYWSKIYDLLNVSSLKNYSAFYIANGLFLPSSNFHSGSSLRNKFPFTHVGISFVSTSTKIINLMAMLKASKLYGIRIHELCYEPNLFDYSCWHEDYRPELYTKYYGYDVPDKDMLRLDSSQYYIERSKSPFDCVGDKTIDFVDGLTNIKGNPTRKPYYDYAASIAASVGTSKLFVYDTHGDIPQENNPVSKSEYLRWIENSRFTMISPAYDLDCLSPYRITESLNVDCLPIIHPECKIKPIEESFGVDLSPLVGLNDFSDATRVKLLDKMKAVFLPCKKLFVTETTQ